MRCLADKQRLKGNEVKQAAPVLPLELTKLFAVMFDSRGHTGLRVAMLVSFRTLLHNAHVTDSEAALRRQDLEFHPWGMVLTIRKSKTNQFREQVHKIPVSKVNNRELCVVFWLKKHLNQCPAPLDAQAFRVPNADHSVPLPYSYYMAVLKAACIAAGLPPANFSTHSLRRGRATFLRLTGASLEQIKEGGDWRSDSVQEYLKESFVERLTQDMQVAVLLGMM